MNSWIEEKTAAYEKFKRAMADFRKASGHVVAIDIITETETMLEALFADDMVALENARAVRLLASKHKIPDGTLRKLRGAVSVVWDGEVLVSTTKRGHQTHYYVTETNRLVKT